jgi:hypothetical protein
MRYQDRLFRIKVQSQRANFGEFAEAGCEKDPIRGLNVELFDE